MRTPSPRLVAAWCVCVCACGIARRRARTRASTASEHADAQTGGVAAAKCRWRGATSWRMRASNNRLLHPLYYICETCTWHFHVRVHSLGERHLHACDSLVLLQCSRLPPSKKCGEKSENVPLDLATTPFVAPCATFF
eukprot:IDg17156t1